MDDTLPPRTIVAQRFVIESRASSGGMGTVYRATDTLTAQPVALKVMGGSAGAQDGLRFAREARLLAELRHPGIVAHVASGQSED
ncbi:MAG TPA: serine/threonine protein kinase, partial [Kofleriaceae bacterium]|nr:serine/threonine protein kinase [Kofleriaceae bacterium]